VTWSNAIHSKPKSEGQGIKLPPEEYSALTHYNYSSLNQFLERMIRYTDIQAKELMDGGYQFSWKDLLIKPLSEFLTRFFVQHGFEDGLHGLALALLQAFSFVVVYLKVWEKKGFAKKI